MSKIRVIAQDVNLRDFQPQNLTTDCFLVTRLDGVFDVIKSRKMVDIFDHYYDLGIALTKIGFSGGAKNPKFQEPEM